jgi:hypothetical protein
MITTNYNKYRSLYYNATFLVVFVLLFALAAFRPVGIDRDSQGYALSIQSYLTMHKYSFSFGPFFYLLVKVSALLFEDVVRGVLIIYAFWGILLTLYAIKKLSMFPMLSLIVYLFLYFPLHAMTQIRLSIVAAIFLLAIPDLVNRKWRRYLVKTAIAIPFHYIALIMPFIYLIKSKRDEIRYYIFLPLIGLLLAIINAGNVLARYIKLSEYLFFKKYYIENIASHYMEYIEYARIGIINKANIFNIYMSSLLIFYYFAIININKFKSLFDVVLIKIFGWMLFLFYLFSFSQMLSGRISEFLGVVLILLLPDMISIIREKFFMSFVISLYSILMAIDRVIVHKLFNF